MSQPDYEPKPNPILGQPATVSDCQRDYQSQQAEAIRDRITTQEAAAKRG